MNVFEVRNLSFTYPKGKEEVIKNVSFDVKEGKIIGLLGPSGAGKSTTQKILIKLLNDYQGTITYNGKDLKHYGKEFYEEIGVGFEMPIHFGKLTALENLNFFASLYQKKVDLVALLTKVNLLDAKDQMVSEFSKGMKVRLNFVRALINDPKVLFLDEPTNGLDPVNAKIIKDMIFDFKKLGKTVFITTHLMGDVEQLCDEVIFIKDGKIGLVSSPRDLKLKYGKKEIKIEYQDNGELKNKQFPLDEIGKNQGFIEFINKHKIETIHSGETSLEDIFIKVIGDEKNV